jgi:zinc protease
MIISPGSYAKVNKLRYSLSVQGSYVLPGPDDIKRAKLSNGIVVLARKNFSSPSVVINGFLTAGSINDPDEKLGLANFVSMALMRGTRFHTFQQLYDILESVGANLGFDGGVHTTSFWGRSLVEDLDMLLDLLAETIQSPTFPNEQVDKLRSQLLASLAIRAQNTGDMASLAFDQIVYRGHPYRRPEDGYPDTVNRVMRDDLEEFHKLWYGPKGMTIAVVGAIEPDVAVERISECFGDWQNPSQQNAIDLPNVQPVEGIVRSNVSIAGKNQSDLVIGCAGPPRRSPDYVPAALGNNILGQFGLMGRIGDVVREKTGLAYYAHSNLSGGIGPGPWTISAGVSPENVDKVISLVFQEVGRFTKEDVGDEELADTQANYIGRLPLSLEANNGVAAAILALERYGLGLDYYQRYRETIMEVTPKAIREVASRYLDPENIAIAIAGV